MDIVDLIVIVIRKYFGQVKEFADEGWLSTVFCKPYLIALKVVPF